jgi:hypothetical protein
MSILNLPNEISIIILKSITDTDSYLNARLTRRLWYSLLNYSVIKFKNNIPIEYIYFEPEKIYSITNTGLINKQMMINQWGSYVYKEYSSNGIIKKEITNNISFKNKRI